MPKQYIVERHHMGFTTRVSEELPKHVAQQLADELNDTSPAQHTIKAVRRA